MNLLDEWDAAVRYLEAGVPVPTEILGLLQDAGYDICELTASEGEIDTRGRLV